MRPLRLGNSAPPASDHLAPPPRIFDPDTHQLVTSIPHPNPFFLPLRVSILSRATLAQCFLVSDCPYDPFDPLDRSIGPGLRFPIPRYYCFANLMFFVGRRPYYLIVVLPTCTIRISRLSHAFVTTYTFQTPRALKALFIN